MKKEGTKFGVDRRFKIPNCKKIILNFTIAP